MWQAPDEREVVLRALVARTCDREDDLHDYMVTCRCSSARVTRWPMWRSRGPRAFRSAVHLGATRCRTIGCESGMLSTEALGRRSISAPRRAARRGCRVGHQRDVSMITPLEISVKLIHLQTLQHASSRPSRNCQTPRRAQARSMPEGPPCAERVGAKRRALTAPSTARQSHA